MSYRLNRQGGMPVTKATKVVAVPPSLCEVCGRPGGVLRRGRSGEALGGLWCLSCISVVDRHGPLTSLGMGARRSWSEVCVFVAGFLALRWTEYFWGRASSSPPLGLVRVFLLLMRQFAN